jgi:hypothetical protein
MAYVDMWRAYSKYHFSFHHQGDTLLMEAVSPSETL